MAHTTIEQFATDLKMPAGALLEQLTAAGVAGKKEGDRPVRAGEDELCSTTCASSTVRPATEEAHHATRKSTSEIKAADSSGKARTIQVEVRKKRVLVGARRRRR